ncbi:protein of unknown function UPF0153 [Thioalkalivibrio nitratireducens DSM 14787]|uniref:Fe-S-cluster oxidoreductase n=1 Tax=Thioalkalivibrio nitratireducens (strain DSM 14787 / UNIQEM 213 / ALEN2) TaxID=1255043 RepID=L0DWM2_THIND|nr:YkgJ family cysteine cluster protein [Thioalkalivibrio nitratireducens]AGA33433.1 protein of unknown function UPF0153 [Thioalkalivibrio nitratireducens DSM 14787]
MTGELSRTSAFSYECKACNRCCRDKKIQLNPYELARLAFALELPVVELIERFTMDGVHLQQRPKGTCVFLGPRGCSVHRHRPLVCRLYPLGRIVNPEGERFVPVQPHPRSEGIHGEHGRVADYLVDQGAAPFMAAADAYYALYLQLADLAADAAADIDRMELLDLDATVVADCKRRGVAPPATLEERVQHHVAVLVARCDSTQRS